MFIYDSGRVVRGLGRSELVFAFATSVFSEIFERHVYISHDYQSIIYLSEGKSAQLRGS